MAASALANDARWRAVLGAGLALVSFTGCGRGDAGGAAAEAGPIASERSARPAVSASSGPVRSSEAQAPGPPASSRPAAGTLTIALRPRLQPRPGLSVMVEVRATALEGLQALGMAPSWAGVQGPRNIHDLAVNDGRGPVPVQADSSTGRYRLERSPAGGYLRASYFAAADEQASRFDLHVDGTGVYGVGHAFLLVPELAGRLAVRLRWDLGELGSAEAASSFGVGQDVRAELASEDVAHSMYLAGPLVVHEGGFGERLVVLGEPSFDTARAIRFCSDALDAARRLFEPADREAFTYIFVPRPHLGNDHDGASLYRSFALWFDQDRSLDARLEILIAHELVHRWIGGTLRLVEPGGAEAMWFTEGFTTHYARSLLYRRGLIRPTDMLAEIQRSLEAEQAAHDPSTRPAAAGAGEGPSAPAGAARSGAAGGVDAPYRYPPVVHHGALYAALVEAELRRNGARSLDQILVQWVERVRASSEPLAVAQWRQALVQELGPSAGEQFDRLIVRDEAAVDPPSDAFDRCFARLVTKDVRYELGFDPAVIGSEPPLVRGLVPGSAAERAGLRDGDLVLSGHKAIRVGDPAHDVAVLVSGERGTRLVRFSPTAVRQLSHWQLAPKCER